MKKKNKKILIIILFVVIAFILIGGTYYILNKQNRYNFTEKNYMNDNKNKLISINVANDINIFGNRGNGVFFEFLNDLEENTGLSFNEVSTLTHDENTGLGFYIKNKILKNDLVFYEDNYVLVSKDKKIINNTSNIDGVIGVLSNNVDYVKTYLPNLNYKSFDNLNDLVNSLSSEDTEVLSDYIIVPLNQCLDLILVNDLYIDYHFSDIKIYYVLSIGNDETLNSIVYKFYNKWYDNNFKDYYNEYKLNLYLTKLNITSKAYDLLTSKVYTLGMTNTAGYEIVKGGNYGGIVGTYLKSFSKFSKIDFEYIKYKNNTKLKTAINKGEIDLYFDYNNFKNNFEKIDSIYNAEYVVIANKNNDLTIDSLNGLKNEKVYVLKNSLLASYLKKNGIKNIDYYENEKELKKINKKDNIVIIDKNSFEVYREDILDKYSIRTSFKTDDYYSFSINKDITLQKLMKNYFLTLNPKTMNITGLNNYYKTLKSGTILSKIAEYLIYIFIIGILVILYLYKKSKKIKLQKRIKKEDKIRFIDLLTSLKNRNYLNENIESWDKNTIYPQTIVIVDLNNVTYVNDTFGHEEGDKQIQAAANILIKTQLDNSDIIRTDGNEFLVYLVGYSEKQVANYIRKLFKEFKNLPYDFGASMGYSMIMDDLKLIDDAINEATIDMRNKKEKEE